MPPLCGRSSDLLVLLVVELLVLVVRLLVLVRELLVLLVFELLIGERGRDWCPLWWQEQ